MLYIMIAEIAGLQDTIWNIRELWDSWEGPSGDGGPHT